jgi:hypothetical protein
MPQIIEYATVLSRMQAMGLQCVYYNGGSFGFPPGEDVKIVGWLQGEDPTIRPGLGATVMVPLPVENLGLMLTEVWWECLPGPAWVLPKAHWSFELGHGNGPWLRETLEAIGIDPAALESRTDAAAIELPQTRDADGDFDNYDLGFLAGVLVEELKASDFAVLFPGHRHLVTLHHHQQIWWQTTDAAFAQRLAGWWGVR